MSLKYKYEKNISLLSWPCLFILNKTLVARVWETDLKKVVLRMTNCGESSRKEIDIREEMNGTGWVRMG